MAKRVEYRVRPVTRYIVTRFELEVSGGAGTAGKSTQHGEFDRGDTAFEVAYALCKAEHQAAGTDIGDMGFIYPKPVEG